MARDAMAGRGDDTAGRRESAARGDIAGRAHLDEVLRRFCTAAFADPLIGPCFDATDLDVHLPRIGDFWERALFRTAGHRRDAFAPHAALHLAAPLTAEHFGRWVQLWHATVDGLHQGPNAERAKAQGGTDRPRDAAPPERPRRGHDRRRPRLRPPRGLDPARSRGLRGSPERWYFRRLCGRRKTNAARR
ncbi:group III truncated hemoglobin [Streptomyces mauvecolor]